MVGFMAIIGAVVGAFLGGAMGGAGLVLLGAVFGAVALGAATLNAVQNGPYR